MGQFAPSILEGGNLVYARVVSLSVDRNQGGVLENYLDLSEFPGIAVFRRGWAISEGVERLTIGDRVADQMIHVVASVHRLSAGGTRQGIEADRAAERIVQRNDAVLVHRFRVHRDASGLDHIQGD